MSTLQERFLAKIEPVTECGCWIWIAGRYANGYGTFRLTDERKSTTAHRVSYQLFNGDIPEGMYVCHRCDVLECVNPSHLFLGTNQDNIADASRKGRKKWKPGRVMPPWNPERLIKQRKIPLGEHQAIRDLYASGLTGAQIAARYGVKHNAIYAILSR